MPDAIFRREISRLIEQLDMYVSSQTAGFRKPNPQGLRMISERYGASMDELVFVGDEEKDRLTAQNAGCRFIHIDRTGNTDGSIADLRELLTSLDGSFFC